MNNAFALSMNSVRRGPLLILLTTALGCGSAGPEDLAASPEEEALTGAGGAAEGAPASSGGSGAVGGAGSVGSASAVGGIPTEVARGSGGEPEGSTPAPALTELVVDAGFLPRVAHGIQDRDDLSDRLPAGSSLAGVTEDAATGQRYVLDPERGIFAVGRIRPS